MKSSESALEDWYQRAHQKHAVESNAPDEVTQRAFYALKKDWVKQTAMYSFVPQIVMNEAYQKIIAMGPTVIPLVLRALRRNADHWFWALRVLTQGADPAKGATDLETARLAWLRWGEEQGYLD